jgi:hypothetical protein
MTGYTTKYKNTQVPQATAYGNDVIERDII